MELGLHYSLMIIIWGTGIVPQSDITYESSIPSRLNSQFVVLSLCFERQKASFPHTREATLNYTWIFAAPI